jgi:MoxR-like ATPase
VTDNPASIDDTIAALEAQGYVCGRPLGTVAFLALALGKPLFLEGEAGVGKTEIAKALAAALGRRSSGSSATRARRGIRDLRMELRRPDDRDPHGGSHRHGRPRLAAAGAVLRRLPHQAPASRGDGAPCRRPARPPDRRGGPDRRTLRGVPPRGAVGLPGDDPGTWYDRAEEPPIVILTSNRTREVHDALKRRCLYHWVDFPSFEREMAILQARVPEATAKLSAEVVAFVQTLRGEDLFKTPGVAESIDWARCLIALDTVALSPEVISDTLGAVLKYQDDIAKIAGSEATAS